MAATALTIEELERWVQFGARWRVVAASEREAVVDLSTCTGELVERRIAEDPVVIAYVRRAGSGGVGED